jgi:hypothetical protein
MSSRRSSSRSAASSSRASIQPSIRRGLESLVAAGENASYIAKMLSVNLEDTSSAFSRDSMHMKIANALEACMGMNNLTAEMLLARFLDVSVLSHYSVEVLEKSGKGSCATLAARIAKEWSKPDFQQPSVSMSTPTVPVAKRKREGDDNGGEGSKKSAPSETVGKDDDDDDNDNDWKRPLFYWKGKLVYDSEKNNLRWDGSWVSGFAEHGLPDEQEFVKAKQTASFELINTGKLGRDPSVGTSEQNGDPLASPLLGVSGRFKGSYLLDQGDGQGPSKYSDKSHHFAIASQGEGTNKGPLLVAAAACGTTAFGSFVSAGYVKITVTPDFTAATSTTEVGELILARRYMGDDDSRTSLVKNAKLVLDACFNKAAPFDPDGTSFWTDLLPREGGKS